MSARENDMYTDDELVMISALQHYVFCKRQCALIHIEQAWAENRLTAEGRILHDRVDQPKTENRRELRTATAVRIRSTRLGLTGVMDMLEFHRVEQQQDAEGRKVAIRLAHTSGLWVPFPVEYKRGKPKEHRADEVQLCAQAMCLEEMLGVSIDQGALFYGQTRRRMEVLFDNDLRNYTQQTADAIHKLLACGETPAAVYSPKCKSCSLLEICQPQTLDGHSAQQWVDAQMKGALK